jgi:hypothetical protein
MVGTTFPGDADDASTLVEILSAAACIFSQVLLYIRENELFSSLLQTTLDRPLRLFLLVFTVFSGFSTGFGTSATSSSPSSEKISPGQDADAPLTYVWQKM